MSVTTGIRPSDIIADTRQHLMGALGNVETEISALWLIRYAQEKEAEGQLWPIFTKAALDERHQAKFPGQDFRFNRLIRDGWIEEVGDNAYAFTDRFIEHLHAHASKDAIAKLCLRSLATRLCRDGRDLRLWPEEVAYLDRVIAASADPLLTEIRTALAPTGETSPVSGVRLGLTLSDEIIGRILARTEPAPGYHLPKEFQALRARSQMMP